MNNLLMQDNHSNSHLFFHRCDRMLTMFSHDDTVRTDGNVIVLTEILDRSVVVLTARARDNVTTEGKKSIAQQGMSAHCQRVGHFQRNSLLNRACLHIVNE